MRKQFEMTQEDLDKIMEASKSAPLIALHCGTPPSAQEMANNAWKKLGEKMGFDYMTVGSAGRNKLLFTAEATEPTA